MRNERMNQESLARMHGMPRSSCRSNDQRKLPFDVAKA